MSKRTLKLLIKLASLRQVNPKANSKPAGDKPTVRNTASPTDILGTNGSLAELVTDYERPQQIAMAELVAQSIDEKQHAIIEAPTGVGKSFAYLVPAVQHALKSRAKVVISTGTIALQE